MAMGFLFRVELLSFFLSKSDFTSFSRSLSRSLALSRPRPLFFDSTARERRRKNAASLLRSVSLSLSLSACLSLLCSHQKATPSHAREKGRKEVESRDQRQMTTKSRKPAPPPSPPSPRYLPAFRFGARRDRIDWGALHGVDVERMVRRFFVVVGGVFSQRQGALLSLSRSFLSLTFCFPSSSTFSCSPPSSLPPLFSSRPPPPILMRSRSASLPSPTETSKPSPAGGCRR